MFLRIYDLWLVGMRQVIRQMRRYLGVFVSIALGTAGFIVVITMGQEVKKTLNLDLDLLGGATVVKVYFEDYDPNHGRFSMPQKFSDTTVEALRAMPGVKSVSTAAWKTGGSETTWQSVHTRFTLVAVDGFFWQVNGLTPSVGELFGAGAVRDRTRVCVIGEELARRIFGRIDVVGELLPIDNDLYRVSGVLSQAMGGDRATQAFIPLTTAQDRIARLSPVDRLYMRCATWDDVSKVADSIQGVVAQNQSAERLQIRVAWDPLQRVQRIAWWIELFVYLAIVATLTLGGVGIWNGMMAAVQSRTREIGLKKAMGAEDRDILLQFLIESAFLSSGSAIVGVAVGRIGVEAVSRFLHCHAPEQLFALCVGFGILFSLLLGIGAGFYPSLRASRMEVVSAIRYE